METKIIVIHDGTTVLQVQIMGDHTTLYGDKSFVVDDKEMALAIAELLGLDNIELIENFELPKNEEL